MPESVPLVSSRPAVPSAEVTCPGSAPAVLRRRNVSSWPAPSITVMCNSIIVGKLQQETAQSLLSKTSVCRTTAKRCQLGQLEQQSCGCDTRRYGSCSKAAAVLIIAMPLLVNAMFSAGAEYVAAIAARGMPGQDPVEPPFSHRI